MHDSMYRHRHIVAAVTGLGLAGLARAGMGWLAAVPAPAPLIEALRGHADLGFLVHTTLLVQLPVALAACAVGCVLFLWLRSASGVVVALCAAPWLVLCVADAAQYMQRADFPASVALAYVLSWQSLLGVAAVPAGLWVARRLQRRDAH